MTIEVLICTYAEGITNTPEVVLPPLPDVKWLISWQPDGYVPSVHDNKTMKTYARLCQRPDITVVMQEGRGLSRNRNNALLHATGDVCVLADDDNRYKAEDLQAVAQLFAKRPDLDVALLKSHAYDGTEMKAYPAEAFDYSTRPYGYYVQSSDIVFRRESVAKGNMQYKGKAHTSRYSNDIAIWPFDEHFGIGAELPGGEDEVFVHRAWKAGMKVEYHPLTLCRTAPLTTGSRMDTDPELLRAKGALLAIMHGRVGALLRVVKYSIAHHVPLRPLIKGVCH